MLSMIKIRPFDTKGIWSITTPNAYESNREIERHPDVVRFIKKNIGNDNYDIEKAEPTGRSWYLIDRRGGGPAVPI